MAICGSARDGDIKFDFLFKFSFFFHLHGVTRLGVTANVRNFKLIVRTVHTYTYHPCKHERFAMSSVAILNCQIWG